MATATLERPSSDAERYSDAELEALTGLNMQDVYRNALPVGRPDGDPTLEELEAEQARENQLTLEQRKAELQDKLTTQRADLVAIAALRGGRVGSRKGGAVRAVYEANLAAHNKTFVELTHLEHPEWELSEDDSQAEIDRKTALATQHYVSHLGELREATSHELRSTKIGKIVSFFNKGGRLRKFVKYAAFGVAAGAVGAAVVATGGAAAGVIGGAMVGGAARFARGAMRAEGERTVGEGVGWRGKKNKAANDTRDFADAFKLAGGNLSLAEAGAAALATIFNKDIKDQQSQRRRSLGWGAFSVAAGATIGHFAGMAANKIGFGEAHANAAPQAGQEGGPTPGSAAHANIADRQSWVDFNKWMDAWIYKPEENPFFKFGEKVGPHDFGPPLHADAGLDADKPAGWNDLTQNRWTNSPEQFASICAALGIDNLPDNADTINGLAEQFKVDPVGYKSKHEAVMSLLGQSTTKVQGPYPIQSTISSEFGKDMGNANMDRFWDDYVDNADKGTKMLITFQDPNTHLFRTIELRCECGGQRMVEHPMPVYTPEPEYVPQGGGNNYVPQGGGTPNKVWSQPEYSEPEYSEPEKPQGGGTPITPQVPSVPITPSVPVVTPPAPSLAPKIGAESPRANPAVPDWTKNLNQLFGNSEAKPNAPAPRNYVPPGPTTSGETVPGAGPKITSPKPAPVSPSVTRPGGTTTRVSE